MDAIPAATTASDPAREAAPSAGQLRARFDEPSAPTVGLEEEVMVLDPRTLDLAPRAAELLRDLDGRFRPELPAAQLEAGTAPVETVPAAAAELLEIRRAAVEAAAGRAVLASAGTHPFTAPEGAVTSGPAYARTVAAFGRVSRLQLVFGLHVHVAVRGAERALAVYNAARSRLPEIAALAASAPFFAGEDSRLASVRPLIAGLLPRQGVPPPLASWDEAAGALAWGAESGAFPPSQWWWELRLHPRLGTLEYRVPDAQPTVGATAAVAAVCHALTVWLADRHERGEPLSAHPSWRIAENRWLALRDGVEGRLADLDGGRLRPTRAILHALLDRLEPVAERLGAGAELVAARALAERNAAMLMRAHARRAGTHAATAWLARRFLDARPPCG